MLFRVLVGVQRSRRDGSSFDIAKHNHIQTANNGNAKMLQVYRATTAPLVKQEKDKPSRSNLFMSLGDPPQGWKGTHQTKNIQEPIVSLLSPAVPDPVPE